MILNETYIPGLINVTPRVNRDERGAFVETYAEGALLAAGVDFRPCQSNFSTSRRAGTVRGMHWQGGTAPQAKYVFCVAGLVDDHVVDVRPGAPGFGRWQRFRLKPGEGAVYIPAGVAHGWQAIEDMSSIVYLVDAPWSPKDERGLGVDDPAIEWALPITVASKRDREWPRLKDLV